MLVPFSVWWYNRRYNQDVARLIGVFIPAYSKMETGVTDLNYSRIIQIPILYPLTPAQLPGPEHDPLKKNSALLLKNFQAQLGKKQQQLLELQSKMMLLYE